MKLNKTKRALKTGETVIGTMVQGMRTPAVAQIMKAAGFDFLLIDMEHSPFDLETVADIIAVARAVDITPIARVPALEYHLMARPLDCGAQGLMLPHVNTKDDVTKIIKSTKFQPLGDRSLALRAPHSDYLIHDPKEFIREANEETILVIQIESREAVENLEEILSVGGIDVALIGPSDLSVSLGVPGEPHHPLMLENIAKVVEEAKKHDIASGIHTGDINYLKEWQKRGMSFLAYSSDVALLTNGMAEAVKKLREG